MGALKGISTSMRPLLPMMLRRWLWASWVEMAKDSCRPRPKSASALSTRLKQSPMIVDPLHLLEIVMPVAGAAAVVVTSAKKAKKLKQRPVYLLGAGEHTTHRSITYAPSLTDTAIRAAADAAFAMAGVRRKDIALASLYDCYTITVLLTLEDAGFAKKGQGGAFV